MTQASASSKVCDFTKCLSQSKPKVKENCGFKAILNSVSFKWQKLKYKTQSEIQSSHINKNEQSTRS